MDLCGNRLLPNDFLNTRCMLKSRELQQTVKVTRSPRVPLCRLPQPHHPRTVGRPDVRCSVTVNLQGYLAHQNQPPTP